MRTTITWIHKWFSLMLATGQWVNYLMHILRTNINIGIFDDKDEVC